MMKKLLVLAALGVAGFVSASTPIEKSQHSILQDNSIRNPTGIIVTYGFGAVDTSDGTCFVPGTYWIDTNTGTTLFFPASLATQSTYVINCTGEGSYLA
ncbi:hypothetical protein MUU74_08220 [Chryseobacterium daecheongense]|uniref:hypothetical protein n=1 Tax=Chryseobacterium daecheongense TaxID=192389 RepID=UPI001FD6C909|nr:hypothetical protein [Chryseobacterium daecheongense]UOU99926.1 hypothetical protein MUU74_08220 [Chryseobacterium daecheongense]